MNLPDIKRRFWEKVDKHGPVPAHRPSLGRCWLWTASRSKGYGIVRIDRRNHTAQRVSFFLAHGKWPTHNACHECDVRHCVRSSHITDGTQSDNIRDWWKRHRTKKNVCGYGHSLTGNNLRLYDRGQHIERVCVACVAARSQRRKDLRGT